MLCCIAQQQRKRLESHCLGDFKPVKREFNMIFKDKRVLQEFKYFLQREFAENIIEFLEDVQFFKSLRSENERNIKASQICSLYFNEESLKEISVKGNTKEEIKKVISSKEYLKVSLFDVAVQEIHQYVLIETWTRFAILEEEEIQKIFVEGKYNHYQLDDIFRNEHLYYVFKSFLKEEYAEEILNFYEEVQNFKKEKDPSVQFSLAKDIFLQYIQSSSSNELNLSFDLRNSMYNIVNNVISKDNTPNHIFDQVFNEVKLNMLLGIWSRFKSSEYYDQVFDL